MNTRKYPRTLKEAFGPYATLTVEQQDKLADKVVLWALGAGWWFVVAMLVWEGMR